MIAPWPTNTRDIINEIREEIGREVTFMVANVSACPVCTYNPFEDTSTNSFCPICSGLYWISVYSGISISGHITWGQADALNWYTAGWQFDGDVRVQIEFTVANLAAVDNCSWVEVDGKKVEVKKRILRGVPAINRILLDCIELEKEI